MKNRILASLLGALMVLPLAPMVAGSKSNNVEVENRKRCRGLSRSDCRRSRRCGWSKKRNKCHFKRGKRRKSVCHRLRKTECVAKSQCRWVIRKRKSGRRKGYCRIVRRR